MVAALLCLLAPVATANEPAIALRVNLATDSGAPTSLAMGDRMVRLPAGGGFSLIDAATKQPIALEPGELIGAGGVREFEARASDLRLHARFTSAGRQLNVEGRIESPSGKERGLVVEYRVAPWAEHLNFSSALDDSHAMDAKTSYEENAYPIGAAFGGGTGLALAIPPSAPCAFGIAGDARGLVVRFYLGVSPETRRFPNLGSFTFSLYAVDPDSAFRSALAQYYDRFPEYYTPRLVRDGLWMFQMEDRIPPNLDQYGFDEIEPTSPYLAAAVARDRKAGIAIFPYTIVGQREIKFLPELPKDYAAATKVLAEWKPGGHDLSKEDVSAEMAAHLKDEIEASACTNADGSYVMVVRNTPWGKNSITYKTNPSPYLFEGQGRFTVGGDTLKMAGDWLRGHPEYAGVYVDSLGANWPATLDYRKDHFASTRHPLTIDPAGRPALQNDIGHYEFLAELRTLLRGQGRLLFANGVYAYKSRTEPTGKVELQTFDNQLNEFNASAAPPEHYHPGARLGRFFDAALLDVAGSEAGVNAAVSRCQDARVFMGRKPYAFLNYRWEDKARVEEMVNKSLAYAIFATCSKNFMTGVTYEDNPNGYLRDKPLFDWFVPLVRTLSRAGWQPVRHARVVSGKVVCERYGTAPEVFFAVYNDAKQTQGCTLELDVARLGLAAPLEIVEIGRQAPIQRRGDQITFAVAAKQTAIIRVRAAAASAAH